MTESADLVRIADQVRAAAEACGAMVVDAILLIEPQSVPVAAVNGFDFPALVKHLRPRLVYLSVASFDAHDCIEAALEGASQADPEFRELLSASSKRNGEIFRVALGVMGDGVLHGIVEVADWFEEFEAKVEILIDVHNEAVARTFEKDQEAERSKADAEEKKRLAPHIKKLVADPRFSAPKVSLAKRIALAETLFPEFDRTTLRKIVERAGSEVWLTSATA